MNNQVKLIDQAKLLEWLEDQKENSTMLYESIILSKIERAVLDGKFDTPPVPTIGCSKCDYKGYFEYETGVVDEGTRIKEIAKEPCDCVIDRVPTIKPGDKVRHSKYGHGDVKKISAWVWFSDGPEYKAISPDELEVVEPEAKEFPDIEELKKRLAAAQEEIAKINCDYYADKQRFVVQRRELAESKAREKKLREAIQTAIEMKELNPEQMVTGPKIVYDAAMWFLSGIMDSLYPKEETKP